MKQLLIQFGGWINKNWIELNVHRWCFSYGGHEQEAVIPAVMTSLHRLTITTTTKMQKTFWQIDWVKTKKHFSTRMRTGFKLYRWCASVHFILYSPAFLPSDNQSSRGKYFQPECFRRLSDSHRTMWSGETASKGSITTGHFTTPSKWTSDDDNVGGITHLAVSLRQSSPPLVIAAMILTWCETKLHFHLTLLCNESVMHIHRLYI